VRGSKARGEIKVIRFGLCDPKIVHIGSIPIPPFFVFIFLKRNSIQNQVEFQEIAIIITKKEFLFSFIVETLYISM
jgi:hypothetical protein